MAMFDSYKAVKTLTGAGFTDNQATVLVETVIEGRAELATKADLQDIEQRLRADLHLLELRMTTRFVIAAAVLSLTVLVILKLIP